MSEGKRFRWAATIYPDVGNLGSGSVYPSLED